MNVLFCSPEVYPFSKIGGVADFSQALPKALNELGNTVYVVTPYYERVAHNFGKKAKYLGEKEIIFGTEKEIAKYYLIEYENTKYYFVSHDFFNRRYFFNHSDDAKRFIFFNIAILEMLDLIDFYPDIIHVNDWSTALVPYFLTTEYIDRPKYSRIKTLLTIHNLERQGAFDRSFESLFTKKNFTYLHLNNINFLKTGIMRSTRINTVSKSYRSEILTKFFGFTLDGALKARQLQLKGIQNSLDFDLYNPETDKFVYHNYNKENFLEGKKANKEQLLKHLGLKDNNKMIVAFISRFAKEKGISLITSVVEEYLKNDDFYFLVIGEGDQQFVDYFNELQTNYPKNCHFVNEHNNEISQKYYAGADLLLMPSLYEASGLNQMIAMRYGTLPLVRDTGGLKDTVINYSKETNNGCGFTFENFDEDEFKEALNHAIDIYYNDKKTWNTIIKNAMAIDNDNETMAKEYIELYKEIENEHTYR
ncbi:MAG: glycogen/starch synthase [Acholeplasma sp.]|nr:glycogen/starch synthase [Acholeplasma sp.]